MPFAKDVQAQFNKESSSFFMSVGLEVSARTGWKPAQDSIAKCSALAPQEFVFGSRAERVTLSIVDCHHFFNTEYRAGVVRPVALSIGCARSVTRR
ncbi:unnamed protein product [Arctia plantaginis]|uniref:Uncharacterized protein n=1 Tax=Arctia plantaginis TaxID=874455 RepID=A0A8S1A6G1_ARCPL|nr:unnamed protein product [Arctia plantaginis]